MTDLLSQIRDATEGSRELDGQIEAFRLGWQHEMWDGAGEVCREDGRIRHIADAAIGHYTTNLQDAVSLVPEGWRWQIHSHQPGFTVVIRSPDARYETPRHPSQGGTYESHLIAGHDASAIQQSTAPLALCIAIIKAHESKADPITKLRDELRSIEQDDLDNRP